MRRVLFTPWQEEEDGPLPTTDEVGGKGYGLYWLAAHGFPVPPTWVISTAAFDLVVKKVGLAEVIEGMRQALAGVGDDWAAAQRALEELEPQRTQVVEGLRQAPMPDRVGAALSDLPLEPDFWAVRSSATAEDDRRHSFAGQFLSLLSVPRGAPIWDGIRKVWASSFGRKALMYCAQNGVPLPRMAVVLQPMAPITAQDRSGVAFSHSPVETLPGVLIQAAFGAGEVVVAGYGGDLYSVQGEAVQVQPMPPSEIRITGPEGGLIAEPPPSGPVLTEEEARELAGLVLTVAERWGEPVNVEFVWRTGWEPELVQVRSAK